MAQRQVFLYIDSTWTDISNIVKYDTLTITNRAFSDTFHYAQNECSFSVIYDPILYPKILAITENTPIQIVDVPDGVLTTEDDQLLLTENGARILIEQYYGVPIFFGHVTPVKTRTYNGVLNNVIIKLSAIDDLDYFNVACGDILYRNHKILDPANPSNSIVHKLAAIAGWASPDVNSDVTIDVALSCFSPDKEDTTVLSALDTLLYEYGYALNLSTIGTVSVKKWRHTSSDMPVYTFDEDNICREISITNSANQYDSIDLKYYNLKFAEKVLLYRDGDCGYASDSSFAGVSIPAGYKYPFDINKIDPVTGLETTVYQTYTDDGISYATNYAVQHNLNYNTSAFSSDFSSIVATESHIHYTRYDDGITIPIQSYGNKKCRIVYNNPTSAALKLYYNNVFGDMYYKTSELTYTINLSDNPSNINSYTSTYIFDDANASNFAKGLAAIYLKNGTKYSFITDNIRVEVGSLISIITNDSTNVLGVVISLDYSEAEDLYTYTVLEVTTTDVAITSTNVQQVASIDTTQTYNYITNVVTAATVADAVADAVATITPSYRGIGVLTNVNTSVYTGAVVNDSGVITVGSSVTPNSGDWMINYASTNVAIGMYVWDGTVWASTTDVAKTESAAIDLCNLQVGGITITGFTTFITAIVKTLFAQQMKLLTGGKLYSGIGTYNNANTPVYIGADGKMSLGTGLVWDGSSLSIAGTVNATEGRFSAGIGESGSLSYNSSAGGYIYRSSGSQLVLFGKRSYVAPSVFVSYDAAVVATFYSTFSSGKNIELISYNVLYGASYISTYTDVTPFFETSYLLYSPSGGSYGSIVATNAIKF